MIGYLETLSLIIIFVGMLLKSSLEKRFRNHSVKKIKYLKIGYLVVMSTALIIGVGNNITNYWLREGIELAGEGRSNFYAGLDDHSIGQIENSFEPLQKAGKKLALLSTIDNSALLTSVKALHDLALAYETVAYAAGKNRCLYELMGNNISAVYKEGKTRISRNPDLAEQNVVFQCTDFDFESSELWSKARGKYNSLYDKLIQGYFNNSKVEKSSNVGELAAAGRSAAYFFVCNNLRSGGSGLDRARKLFQWAKEITEHSDLKYRHDDVKARLGFVKTLENNYNSQESNWPTECRPQTTQEVIPETIKNQMLGSTWHENLGCPLLNTQSLLRIPYWGFDNQKHQGELIVKKNVSGEVAEIMNQLYTSRFPIQQIKLMRIYSGDDYESMKHNNSSAFNCRNKTNKNELSGHSFGVAIDINPIQNPYVKENLILPPKGTEYLDRSKVMKGMIVSNSPVVTLFKSYGWEWGGDWETLKDYMHFSKRVD